MDLTDALSDQPADFLAIAERIIEAA